VRLSLVTWVTRRSRSTAEAALRTPLKSPLVQGGTFVFHLLWHRNKSPLQKGERSVWDMVTGTSGGCLDAYGGVERTTPGASLAVALKEFHLRQRRICRHKRTLVANLTPKTASPGSTEEVSTLAERQTASLPCVLPRRASQRGLLRLIVLS
jgi:hypothetical protein